jgi:hypothetical protein
MMHMEADLYALSIVQGGTKGVQSLGAPRQREVKAAQTVVLSTGVARGVNMMVVGKVLKGRQISVLRMAGEGGASLKDAGTVLEVQVIIVLNMVVADASSL